MRGVCRRWSPALVLLCASAPSLHAGDLYRLTDERGNVIYTDKVPPVQA